MSMATTSLTTALLAILAIPAIPASAVLFIVDTETVDLGDLVPGNGKCEWGTIVPLGQRCTLRAAVEEANALAGYDVILIPDGWRIVLSHNGAPLDIFEDVGIGSLAPPEAWPAIDGAGVPGFTFDVESPATLTIAGLQLTNGGVVVRSNATAELSDCRLYENNEVGAATTNYGTTSISNCTIEKNRFPNTAAIVNLGWLEMVESTVAFNVTAGAIRNHEGAFLRIRNSTIADNLGDGILSQDDQVLWNVTITGNSNKGVRHTQAGAFASPEIKNSIIAENEGGDCYFELLGGSPGTGYPNLDGDGSCGFLVAYGGLSNTDPMLLPLELNGGTTRTRVPSETSPAIDAGGVGCEAVDQRGAPRPLDGDGVGGADCDLGAVEVLPCVATPHLVVTGISVGTPVTYTACYSISAGPALAILSSGDVTLRARVSVDFAGGFSVQSGGEFHVVLDPAAGSGITLP